MRTRLLDIVGELTTRRPGAVLVLAGIVALLGAWLGFTRLPLDADTDHLIRADRPFMVRYRQFLDEFGDLEFIFAVLDTQPDEAQAVAAAVALEARLRAIDGLRAVHGFVTVDEQLRLATRAAPERDLQGMALAGEGIGALAAAAKAPPTEGVLAIARMAASLLAEATSAMPRPESQSGVAVEDLRHGRAAQSAASAILMLRSLLAGADEGQAALLGALAPAGQAPIALRADGGRYLLIQILPVKDFSTSTVIERPLRAIRAAIAQTQQEFPDVAMGLTGKPVLQADELLTSNADMVRGASIGLLCCAVLLMVAMHGVVRPLLCVCAFVVAFAWTCGFAALAVGRLNLLSMVFMLVLVANGLDYGVHVIARYLETRAASNRMSVVTAMQSAVRVSLRGNLTGAMTSCAVFLTAMATNFQGLRELGVIASAGLLLCVIAMGSVLPALLVVAERRHAFAVPRLVRSGRRSRVLGVPLRKPAATLMVVAAATAVLALALPRLRFEENLLNLQNPTLDSVRWERRLAAESAGNSWFGAVVVDDLAAVASTAAEARRQPAIGAVRSILDVVAMPTVERELLREQLKERAAAGEGRLAQAQRELVESGSPAFDAAARAKRMAALLEDAIGPLRLVVAGAAANAPEEAAALGQLVSSMQRTLAGLHGRTGGSAAPRSPVEVLEACASSAREVGIACGMLLAGNDAGLAEALPEAVRGRSMAPSGRFLLMLHPRDNVWDAEHMREFIAALRAVDPEATGVPFTHYESLVDMRRAFLTMAGLSVLLVAVLLLVDFRRPTDVLLALLPLGLSITWTLSLMGWLGVPLNLANFFAVPILIGLGVDGAVHLLHRYHEPGDDPLDPGSTRRALVLSNLTTTIGFAPLLLASHQGMLSLGSVMVLGNTAALGSLLFVLPALLSLRERWRGSSAGG